MDLIDQLKRKAQSIKRSIVFPEGDDVRILEAARCLVDQDIAEVIVLGDPATITEFARQSEIAVNGVEIIDPNTSNHLANYAERYVMNRARTKPAVALRIVQKPLNFAAMMVKVGHADLFVAGISYATRRVIEAAGACIGLTENSNLPSSFFVMLFKDRTPLIFADCAVNVDPTAEELADIAITTAVSAERLLGIPAKIALLSFSTKGSASHARVDKITEALRIAREREPDLNIDGELQVDSALIGGIAAQKTGDSSPAAGSANVLVFPDLDAANIGYKLVKHLAHAQAIGPILQGFAFPVADLSRGASVEEIVATCIAALAMA